MTDRKPALNVWEYEDGETLRHVAQHSHKRLLRDETRVVVASDIPPAILNATKEELAALAVFAEAMPGLLHEWDTKHVTPVLKDAMDAALAAAKSQ